jgi:hypothetical protein
MDDQPKVLPQTASDFFFNGASMREPVPGTIPIGGLKEDAAFFTGKGADGQFVATVPVPQNEALLERGRQRYVIYCQPCHDARGEGKGILFQRGNVPTASFHDEKILKYPDGQIFDVMTNGMGLMPSYKWPIPPSTGGQSSPTFESSSGGGRQALQARARRTSEGGTVSNGVMNGAMNRKLLFIFGPVTGLVMFAAVIWMASTLVNREYKEPYRVPSAAVDATPRTQGVAAESADAESKAKAKPYVEASTEPFRSLAAAWRSGRSPSSICSLRRSS